MPSCITEMCRTKPGMPPAAAYGPIIDGPPRQEGSTQENVCVFADREVDRSPIGTGTAERVAQLYARGRLKQDEVLVNESVIGTTFTGRVVGHMKVGEFDAVIPEVGGKAAIVGFNQWVVDPEDPAGEGFFLR